MELSMNNKFEIFRAHPWHGIPAGEKSPEQVNCYIEIVSTDTVKYELDKEWGILKLDRPQQYSNHCPSLYGFIPQTYCGKHIADLSMQKTGLKSIVGDGDPLDICVLTEKNIFHGDILLKAIPIGGLRLIDQNQADDKIISVLVNDFIYGSITDISECSSNIIDRLRHYFITYKETLTEVEKRKVTITHVYGSDEAKEVIKRSQLDYLDYKEAFLKPIHVT